MRWLDGVVADEDDVGPAGGGMSGEKEDTVPSFR